MTEARVAALEGGSAALAVANLLHPQGKIQRVAQHGELLSLRTRMAWFIQRANTLPLASNRQYLLSQMIMSGWGASDSDNTKALYIESKPGNQTPTPADIEQILQVKSHIDGGFRQR